MKISLFSLLILCFFASENLTAQTSNKLFQRVEINLSNRSIQELGSMGMDLDHGVYRKGRSYTTELSDQEAQQLIKAGWEVKILVPDLQKFYFERSQNAVVSERSGTPCPGSSNQNDLPDPAFYTPGSLSGFFRYSEILNNLDDMQALYPNLISARQSIGNFKTTEGRPIFWVQISDKPDLQEFDEPEILFTGLHHAREPISATQMIWYMWYLLENYSINPEIKYLVDHSGQYFIPCVNPDGYLFNENQFPDEGGMWRKNLRDNADGSFGVDLNRNYPLGWGFDDSGSSPEPNSITYRGPFAQSEPEVQALMAFSAQHQFLIALNYHSFGNLLLHPWGYLNEETADSKTFKGIANVMNEQHAFSSGLPLDLLGYPVNGQADDWQYDAYGTFSYTPEVGTDEDGFWPAPDRIIPLNKQCLPVNLNALRSIHSEAKIVYDDSPILVDQLDQNLKFRISKTGLKSGAFTLNISSLDPYIQILNNQKNFNLAIFDEKDDAFQFQLKTPFSYGDSAHFVIQVDNGYYTRKDTVVRLISKANAFFDPANVNSFTNWSLNNGNDWQLTPTTFYSAPSSFTDSPDAPYEPNGTVIMRLLNPEDLSNANQAELRFNARWDIEKGFDYAQVDASSDGINFKPLCGHYTIPGLETQDLDNPIYDGEQLTWVQERMDVSDFVGGPLYIRFKMISDAVEQKDGIYIDDIYIIKYEDKTLQTSLNLVKDFTIQQFPNPANESITLQFDGPGSAVGAIKIYNTSGILVKEIDQDAGKPSQTLDLRGYPNGMYYYQVLSQSQELMGTRKFIVSHK